MRQLACLALFGALCLPLGAQGADVVRRAIVVGANDGGSYLDPLLYAERDAERVSDVLIDLADFRSYDVDFLATPTLSQLDEAFAAAAGASYTAEETLFVFYYSGHADEQGLHIAGEVYPWERLKAAVRAVPAEVHLGILDACRSGAVTRIKGASVSEPFLPSSRLDAEGEAWISSAADDEDAQESDLLRGSFFTYHLVSGLRGAADEGEDGWVSLNEAYTYAYGRTVAQTSGTGAGTQHPRYAFDIQGNGDLRLTSVQAADAMIAFPEGLVGDIVVLAEPEGLPVGELTLDGERERVLAVAPGTYRVRRRDDTGLTETTVHLLTGHRESVDEWSDGLALVTTAKGVPDDGFVTVRMPSIDLSWFAQNKGIAAGLSAVIPGVGQMYSGRWVSGSLFFTSNILSNGVGWGAAALDPASIERGAWTGPNPGTLAGLMLYTWNIADAIHHTGQQAPFGPRSGIAMAVGTGWATNTIGPASTGLSFAVHPTPEVGIGLDRTGFLLDDDIVVLRASMRVSAGPAFDRWHPAAFFAMGARYRYDLSGDTATHGTALMGVGGMLRWYATPAYYLSVDARTEWSSNPGELALSVGAELGLHLGKRQVRRVVYEVPQEVREE